VSALSVAARTIGLLPGGERGTGIDLTPWQRTLRYGPHSLQLACYAAGDPAATRLVLVHGTPGSARGWARYLQDPPAGCEVLVFDRPGFGGSAPREALPSIAAQAQAVAALLPTDGREAVLLGHSLGGAVAAYAAAASKPGQVRALVLLAAALDPALERIHPLQRLGARAPVRALLPRPIRNANAELIALPAELEALAPQLERIRCPVHIVHGSADDLVSAANVPYIKRNLGGAPVVHTRLVQGGSHFLPWDAESLVREVVAVALAGERP
jgi:pimeloyl-ACP methyl ester carboxylesterase